MKGYLLICFIETEKIYHNQKNVNEIINLINNCDVFESSYTDLFNESNNDILTFNFSEQVSLFLDDPYGIFWEEDEEDEEEYDLRNHIQQQDTQKTSNTFEYDQDFMSVYLYYVSCRELFKRFCAIAQELNVHNCTKIVTREYTLSCLEQTEIFKKLQKPKNSEDIVRKALYVKNKQKRRALFKKLHKKHLN